MKKTIGITLGLLATLSLVAAGGCSKKKSKKPADGERGPAVTDQDQNFGKPGAVPAAGAKPKAGVGGGPGADTLAYLPADTKLAIGVNVKAARQSPLFAQVKSLAANDNSKIAMLLRDCKFDPLSQVDWVLVGAKSVASADDVSPSMVVKGQVDEASVMGCVVDKGKAAGEEISVEDHNGKKIYTSARDTEHSLAFLEKDLLLVGTKPWLTSVIDGARAGKDAPVATTVAKLDTTQTVWLAALDIPEGGLGGPFAMLPVPQPKAAWGTVDVSQGITLNLFAQLGSADEAQSIADLGKSGMLPAKMFTRLAVDSQGDILHVDLEMTEQQIMNLKRRAESFMRGGMGGGMGMPPGAPPPPPGP